MTITYTHTGYRSHVGHVHCGARLWGHRMPKPGRRHALNGGPAVFAGLCGEKVVLEARDEFGDPVAPNVRGVEDPECRAVTCKRCLRRLKA